MNSTSLSNATVSQTEVAIDNLLHQPEILFERNDFVLVNYNDENGEKKYIAKIPEVIDDETYLLHFLKPKDSRECKGYVYSYCDRTPPETCCKNQILYKLNAEIFQKRSLKFDIHCNELMYKKF